ncbi:MAG TPA: hypothetical protein V6D17_01965 [Candidatus Obscuribacterales bacterium]
MNWHLFGKLGKTPCASLREPPGAFCGDTKHSCGDTERSLAAKARPDADAKVTQLSQLLRLALENGTSM